MKTTIKSFIIICALGLAGISNVKATENCGIKDLKQTSANQALSELNNNSNEAALNESIDYQKEAQLLTHLIADQAEAKVTLQVIGRSSVLGFEGEFENNDSTTDFRSEAQSITKTIADKAEAIAIKKLVDEGRITENR